MAAARNDVNAWMMAALTQLKLVEYSKARADVQAALAGERRAPGAYTLLGMAKVMAGDDQGAKADYRKAIEMNTTILMPTCVSVPFSATSSDLTAARPYLQQALRVDPSSLSALYEWALVEIAEGQDAAAMTDLEQIVQKAPNLLKPHVRLAALFYRVRRNEDGTESGRQWTA